MPSRTNPLSYFPTPEAVGREMLALTSAQDDPELRILEPSAGEGHLARLIRTQWPQAQLDVVELHYERAQHLAAEGFAVACADFLEWEHEAPYHLVLMNPPFSVYGTAAAYREHILHAAQMLAPGGRLVSVVPASAAQDEALMRYIQPRGGYAPLDRDAFRGSGTIAATGIVWASNDDLSWRKEPVYGYQTRDIYMVMLRLANSSELAGYAQEVCGQLHRFGWQAAREQIKGICDIAERRAREDGAWLTPEEQGLLLHEYYRTYYQDWCKAKGVEPNPDAAPEAAQMKLFF